MGKPKSNNSTVSAVQQNMQNMPAANAKMAMNKPMAPAAKPQSRPQTPAPAAPLQQKAAQAKPQTPTQQKSVQAKPQTPVQQNSAAMKPVTPMQNFKRMNPQAKAQLVSLFILLRAAAM
ncbi:hypothetical protein HDU98_011708 [Podochytrium sp. JEL0797]|nr:hypothetical protein HDU98_011708 [Podochytrium sp. JEL0797]